MAVCVCFGEVAQLYVAVTTGMYVLSSKYLGGSGLL